MTQIEAAKSRDWGRALMKSLYDRKIPYRPINIHGEKYQERGIADHIWCINGSFCGFEFKQGPTKWPTGPQAEFLWSIHQAKGLCLLVQFVGSNTLYWQLDSMYPRRQYTQVTGPIIDILENCEVIPVQLKRFN